MNEATEFVRHIMKKLDTDSKYFTFAPVSFTHLLVDINIFIIIKIFKNRRIGNEMDA